MAWVFRATVVVLAVHAVYDPYPAGPLAVLCVRAIAYRRWPALCAFVVGLLAVEAGVLRGWVALPFGLALIVLSVRAAWRPRLLHVAGLLVGAYVVLVPVAMALYATHRPRAAVPALPHREVHMRTTDGVLLEASYSPPRNGAVVISFPTRKGKLEQAQMLIRHGYGVLLLDMRGYEGSGGEPNAFGWGSAADIDAAVSWLRARPGVRAIGGIGFSVGGEVMLEAAARNPALRAVVSEGAGERSVRETLVRGPKGWPAVPSMAVQTAALALLTRRRPPPALDDHTPKIAPRAVFFVYGEHGNAGEELTRDFFAAARAPKQIWRVPGAGHTGGYAAAPREYERRVVGFFDRHLLGTRKPCASIPISPCVVRMQSRATRRP
jgi:dienelactone hydrolase